MVEIHTDYEEQEARALLERKPALLEEEAGAWYDEFSNLRADGLQVTDAGTEVLARYEHPHHGRWPAITTRETARAVCGSAPGISSTGEICIRSGQARRAASISLR